MESSKPTSLDIKARFGFQITKTKLAHNSEEPKPDHTYAHPLIPKKDKEEICQKLAVNSAIHVVSAMMKTKWECCTAHLAWELYLQLKELVIPLNNQYHYFNMWKKVQSTVINKDKVSKVRNKTACANRGAKITLSSNKNSYEIEFSIVAGFYPEGVETNTSVEVQPLEMSEASTPSTLFEQMIDQVYEVRRQYKKSFLTDPEIVNEIIHEIFKPSHAVTSPDISRIMKITREVEMEVNFELTFLGSVPIELRDRKIIIQKAVLSAVLHSEPARNPVRENDAELAWKLFLLMADKPYEPSMTHKCKPLFVPVNEHIAINESMSKKRTYCAKINLTIKSKSYAIRYIIGTSFHLYTKELPPTLEGGARILEITTSTEGQPRMIKAYDACKTILAEIRKENKAKIHKEIVKVLEKQWPGK
ncbi:hypothetical protein TKK_0014453 [Trichogramma kaykai]